MTRILNFAKNDELSYSLTLNNSNEVLPGSLHHHIIQRNTKKQSVLREFYADDVVVCYDAGLTSLKMIQCESVATRSLLWKNLQCESIGTKQRNKIIRCRQTLK